MFFTADGNEVMNHFINEHIAARLAKRNFLSPQAANVIFPRVYLIMDLNCLNMRRLWDDLVLNWFDPPMQVDGKTICYLPTGSDYPSGCFGSNCSCVCFSAFCFCRFYF